MIKFKEHSSWRDAEKDGAIFKDWLRGKISTRYACELIAYNNDLLEVLEEEFIETAKALGYRRRDNV